MNKFKPGLMRRICEFSQGAPEQIGFIVGTGRCGTTILAGVLNSHSSIVVPPELQFLDKLLARKLSGLDAKQIGDIIEQACPYQLERYFDYRRYLGGLGYPQKDLAVLLRGLFAAICKQFGKSVFLEQTPWHGRYLSELKKLFPEMKIIHLVRDPRDVLLSFVRTPYGGGDKCDPVRWMFDWEYKVTTIHRFGETMDGNFVEIRYEDMVTESEGELSRVLRMFGLSMESSMLDPANLIDYRSYFRGDNRLDYQSEEYRKWRASEAKNIFFSDNVYGWKRHREYDFGEASYGIAGTLELYGYEITA